MFFRFDVHLTDRDYYDFNLFLATKSHWAKGTFRLTQIICGVLFGFFALVYLVGGGFSAISLLRAILLLLWGALFAFGLGPFYRLFLKGQLKQMKKGVKMPYTADAVLEFADESFKEITQVNKTEQRYCAVERVSILSGKAIYIHINRMMAYLLPIASFDSLEEWNRLIAFLEEKEIPCDYYK